MATNALATQQLTDLGAAPAYTAAGATPLLNTGDAYTFNNDGRTLLYFKKTGAGACTVTVVTPNTVRGKAIADTTFVVPATTGDVMAGPFPPDLYNDANSNVSFSVSDATGLSVAIVRI